MVVRFSDIFAGNSSISFKGVVSVHTSMYSNLV